MLSVGKHLRLKRQERAAGINEIHTREAVLECDLLRAKMLFDRDGVIRSALYRRIVRENDDVAAGNSGDAGDEARAGRVFLINAVAGQGGQLEER